MEMCMHAHLLLRKRVEQLLVQWQRGELLVLLGELQQRHLVAVGGRHDHQPANLLQHRRPQRLVSRHFRGLVDCAVVACHFQIVVVVPIVLNAQLVVANLELLDCRRALL